MSGSLVPEDPIGEPLGSAERTVEDGPLFDEIAAPASPPVYPFWGWLDVLLFVVVLVACLFLASVILAGINIALVASGYPQYALSLAQIAALIQLLAFGPALFVLSLVLRARYQQGLRAAAQLGPIRNLGIYAGAGLATAILVSVLNYVFKLQELDMPMNELIKSDADLILIGIAAFTFGPLFEEIIFRGILQPLFVSGMGAVAGIFVTALLFALPHGTQYGWHWQLILIITVAGCVFGFIRWQAQSTTASTIAHAAYNGLLLVGAVAERMKELS
ncbi:MAG: type II CAAX endopeptidase family protein [Bryobacterales bacterium]|nr:type II CAAX endopeptidase family protein [Bryobacterales bacterium]